MLQSDSLFFPRGDVLSESDPLEGGVTSAEADSLAAYERSPTALARYPEYQTYLRLMRERFAISSWHAAAHESVAMWKLYGDRGISIRSSLGRLEDALRSAEEFHWGLVEYQDFRGGDGVIASTDAQRISADDIHRFFRKDISFQHEQEFRVVLHRPVSRGEPIPHPGMEVPVSVSTLIQEIVTFPSMPQWIFETIRNAVEAKDVALPVRRSGLGAAPPESILRTGLGVWPGDRLPS